jgi:hypothetical protein
MGVMVVKLDVNLLYARRLAALIGGPDQAHATPEGDWDGPWQVTVGAEKRLVARGLTADDARFIAGAAATWASMCAEVERLKEQLEVALAVVDDATRAQILARLAAPQPGAAVTAIIERLLQHGGQVPDDPARES